MRIYISGAMASCKDTYKGIFYREQRELEKDGHIVINPAILPEGLDHDKYMPICLAMIDGADAIYMFNNWQDSTGALLELAYATYQGKTIIYGE